MNKKTSVLIWITAIVLLIVAATTIYYKFMYQREDQIQTEVKTTQPRETSESTNKVIAPDFTLKDMSGKSVKLSDYKGKVVILNFWAVWCYYCKQEMPDLNELNQTLVKDGDVVLLAIDVQENISTVKQYIEANKFSINVLMDTDGSVAGQYGITGFPTTFILDRYGAIYKKLPGATNKETLQKIINEVK